VGQFTDGIFAIAITLLVFEIARPDGGAFAVGPGVPGPRAAGRLWNFLVEHDSAFYAYLLAFFVLWLAWRWHHALLERVSHVPSGMIGWHFPLLLLAAFLPYVATVLGHYFKNPLAGLSFGVVVLVMLLSLAGIQIQARRDGTALSEADQEALAAEIAVTWEVVVYWAAVTALVWWVSWAPFLWIAAIAVGSAGTILGRRRARRRRAASG
jgi:uncharacterized membrane protein